MENLYLLKLQPVQAIGLAKIENIPELRWDKKLFLIVGEAEVAKQKCINVLVGTLDTTNETFPIECLPLESSCNVAVLFYMLWMTY